tara:strand:- start:30 stop:164 length:135 start_codon:yes stop_codon:yes gene_type:complete
MIKKFILILIFCGTIISCGKKNEVPEYKEPNKKAEIQNIIVNKA